jgi:hypothetical protein
LKTFKKITTVLAILLAFTLVFSPMISAQSNVRITKVIYSEKQIARAAGDSTYTYDNGQAISLAYPLTGPISELRGQWPDSIRIINFGNGDSTCTIQINWKARFRTATGYTSVRVDSVYAATAIESTGGKTLTNTYWQNYDYWGLSVIAPSGHTVTNALNAATATKFTILLELWYHKPGAK